MVQASHPTQSYFEEATATYCNKEEAQKLGGFRDMVENNTLNPIRTLFESRNGTLTWTSLETISLVA